MTFTPDPRNPGTIFGTCWEERHAAYWGGTWENGAGRSQSADSKVMGLPAPVFGEGTFPIVRNYICAAKLFQKYSRLVKRTWESLLLPFHNAKRQQLRMPACCFCSFVGKTHQTLWQTVIGWCANEASLSSSTIALLLKRNERWMKWKKRTVSTILTAYKLVKHCDYAVEPGMWCLPRETAAEMCNMYVSQDEIQWVLLGLFKYYILQLRSQRAPSAFHKVSYFMLACVSVKWERVRLIDRGSVEMMHFPCDCFHSHYSQQRVISSTAADTSACAPVTQPSLRRVRLPLPQHWSLIARLNQ